MDRNLYAPPTATVADPVEPPTNRPVEVTWAVRLVGASLIVGFGADLWTNLVQISVPALIFTVISESVRYVLSVFVLLKIASGRNWARLFFLAVLALGLGYTAYNWHNYAALFDGKHPVTEIAAVSKVVLDIAAACLLLLPKASRWFKPPRVALASAGSATAQGPSA